MSIFSNRSSKIFVNYIFHFFGIMNRTMLHLSISIYKIWISPDFLNFTHILFCWILYLISLISFWFFWSLFNCLWTRFQLSISIFNIVIFPVFLNIAHILFYFILDFLSDLFHQFLILLNSFYLLVFFVSDIFHRISCYQPYLFYLFYQIICRQLIFHHHFQLYILSISLSLSLWSLSS